MGCSVGRITKWTNVGYAGTATRRPGLTIGVASTFSFSLCSLTSDALKTESRRAPLERSDSSDDVALAPTRRAGFTVGVAEDARPSDDGMRVGVDAGADMREPARLIAEGGPMLLSTAARLMLPVGALVRALLANGFAEGGSLTLRSLLAVLPVSDNAEGGLDTLGVPKIEDSRRKGAFTADD